MNALAVGDRLEVLGLIVGALLLLGGLGSLYGMPWETNPDTLAVIVQLLGVVLSIAVGAALVWLVRLD
jgi:hypothetical protein